MADWPPAMNCGNCGWWKGRPQGWLERLMKWRAVFGDCKNPKAVEAHARVTMTHKHYICRNHSDSGFRDVGPSLACFERACERIGIPADRSKS